MFGCIWELLLQPALQTTSLAAPNAQGAFARMSSSMAVATRGPLAHLRCGELAQVPQS